MKNIEKNLMRFIERVRSLSGDSSDAFTFYELLFQAFGYAGIADAGAIVEAELKDENQKKIGVIDLLWKDKLLIEMKNRGSKLENHRNQLFNYWIGSVPKRPKYAILSNFDEFWIYDFNKQIVEPVDKIHISELPKRYEVMNIMFQETSKSEYSNDLEITTRDAAAKYAKLYNSIIERHPQNTDVQLFIIQLLITNFSEDAELLPRGTISRLVKKCLNHNYGASEQFGLLFNYMNNQNAVVDEQFKDIPYFNGELFNKVYPLELNKFELELIGNSDGIISINWSQINLSIFGIFFQQFIEKKRKYFHKVHYTGEKDVYRVIYKTIVEPFEEELVSAETKEELLILYNKVINFRVLDPACGNGNFLYLAFQALIDLELEILSKIKTNVCKSEFYDLMSEVKIINPLQFYGIEIDTLGVELTKFTLLITKKVAFDKICEFLNQHNVEIPDHISILPLDNLEKNIIRQDALLFDWPEVDVIVGNPPLQSGTKISEEFGNDYLSEIREKFPDVPIGVDFCVYWFRKAHKLLKFGQRAGLIGSNIMSKNENGIGSLAYISDNSGTMIEAVSTQAWPNDPSENASIVIWVKGEYFKEKMIFVQEGNLSEESPWSAISVDEISFEMMKNASHSTRYSKI